MKWLNNILGNWVFRKVRAYIMAHPEEFVDPLRDGGQILQDLIEARSDGKIDARERAALEDQAKGLVSAMMRIFGKALRE